MKYKAVAFYQDLDSAKEGSVEYVFNGHWQGHELIHDMPKGRDSFALTTNERRSSARYRWWVKVYMTDHIYGLLGRGDVRYFEDSIDGGTTIHIVLPNPVVSMDFFLGKDVNKFVAHCRRYKE